jgi:hypothetical protein
MRAGPFAGVARGFRRNPRVSITASANASCYSLGAHMNNQAASPPAAVSRAERPSVAATA